MTTTEFQSEPVRCPGCRQNEVDEQYAAHLADIEAQADPERIPGHDYATETEVQAHRRDIGLVKVITLKPVCRKCGDTRWVDGEPCDCYPHPNPVES